MDIVILPGAEQVASYGAALVRRVIRDTSRPVLGLATGSTPLALYRRLIADCEQGELSFQDVTTFNLDEYLGIRRENPQSYHAYMRRELFDHVDIDPANTWLPECGEGKSPLEVGPAYEERIREAGGIDLQLLGIGANGHIGFNEPASSLSSRTRIKTLTRATVEANRQYFDDQEEQPELAITMGIGTILDTREILLLATGAAKAAAVRDAIEGPVSAACPASALQLHQRVTVLLETEAAAALESRDYYEGVQEQKQRLVNEQGGPR